MRKFTQYVGALLLGTALTAAWAEPVDLNTADAKTIAEVMCGGDVEADSMVDEHWLMTLERKAFMGLLTHPKTQERIMGMMQTGKPVRN
jgi:hypothetical protein